VARADVYYDWLLSVTNGAELTASSEGNGAAGHIEVAADSIRLSSKQLLMLTPHQSRVISVCALVIWCCVAQSNITTNATGTASGGNININSDVIAALEDSDITANAQNARGGQVIIDAQGIFRTEDSDITASSNLGREFSGTVEINNPDVDPTQGLVELPAEVVDASNQIATGCPEAVWRGESKFIITGRGGLPPSPTEPLRGDNTLTNWSTLDSDLDNRSSTAPATNSTKESAPTQIVEANGWVKGPNGEVTLVATAPTATLDIPWLPSSDCHAPATSS
jgi:large exoprotein involved in heme utilization and adhesion